MTQTVSPVPPLAPPPGPPFSTPPATGPAPSPNPPAAEPGRLRAALAGTPGRLRVASAVAVLATLLFAVLGAVAVQARSGALGDAQASAAQLVRVQTIRTALVQADADATNAFLNGGLEPPAQRADYVASIGLASRTIADAAQNAPADAQRLGQVNDALARYTGLIESARANNRQGFPVGVAYLKNASTLLRTEILPQLSALSAGASAQVDDAYGASSRAATVLLVALVGALVLLIGAQLVLARRTHRVLSMPVFAATMIVLVVGLVIVGTMAWAQSRADNVRSGAYAQTAALAQARVDAFDAKSNESLTLISRGSGAAYEQAWQTSADAAASSLARVTQSDAPSRFADWRAIHVQIRQLDDAGDWDGAVALATRPIGQPGAAGTSADGANTAFAAFATSSADGLSSAAAATDDGLATPQTILTILALLVLVAGVLAAVAAWFGFSVRIDEYR